MTNPSGDTHRSADAFFRTVFDESPVGMALISLDFRFLRANAVLCHVTGYSEEELLAKSVVDITHPDDVGGDARLAQRLLRGEIQRYQIEKRYIRKDGAVLWTLLGRSLVRDADGRPLYFVATVQDRTEQQRLRDDLARSERHHRALIESSRDMLNVVDRDGRNLYVSPANQRVAGWSREERLGRDAFDIIHPDDQERVRAAFARVVSDPSHHLMIEYRLRHRDGRWIWVEATGHNLLDDPAVGGVVVNARDVSARRAVEEQLARSDRQQRALIENSQDIVVVIDAAGVQRYLSPSVERVLGWKPEELLGHTAFEHVYPDDVPRLMAVFAERSAEPGARDVIEFRHRHKDGRWLHLESVGHNLLHDPVVAGIVLNSRDVTARKLAEERLAIREHYFRALIEQVSDAITILEPDGMIRYISPQIERILGYAPEDIEKTSIFDLVHPDDRAQIAADVAAWPSAPHEAPGSRPARFRARHKDGSWRHIEGTGRISFDDSVVRGVVGSVRDVSERVAVEVERERLIAELTEALAQVRTLHGLLPICSACKRVRDDKGYWTQIESYLSQHSQTEFSHGICPSCAKHLYPEYFADTPTDELR